MSDGVTVIIMISPAQGKEGDVLNKLQSYAKAIENKDKNIMAYHIADIVETSDDGGKEFVTLTRYTNQAAVDAHLASPEFTEVRGIESMVRKPVIIKHMKDAGGFRIPGAA